MRPGAVRAGCGGGCGPGFRTGPGDPDADRKAADRGIQQSREDTDADLEGPGRGAYRDQGGNAGNPGVCEPLFPLCL